jgi:putative hydrolase of the HAD superfamily
MNKPKGVIFDFGNTILAEDKFDWLAGTKRMLEFATGPVSMTAEEILEKHHQLNAEINLLREQSMLEFTMFSLQKVLYESLGLNIALKPDEMERKFWRAAQCFRPAEGIYAVMDLLESQGINTGILSNCPFTAATMNEELIKHNLSERFDFFISSADYGFRKPHPRIFQAALHKIGLQPQDVWFVGDKLEYDVKGAIGAGLFPVWYNSQNEINSQQYECLEVKTWYEFIEQLKRTY